MERRPGQDVAEQLSLHQSNLKEKKRNVREVEQEVLRYKREVGEHREVLRSLHTRMEEIKQEYFVRMRSGGGALRFPQMGGGGDGAEEKASTLFFGHGEEGGAGMRAVPPLESDSEDEADQ